MRLHSSVIKEIAQHLDSGSTCYINRNTGEIKVIENAKEVRAEGDEEAIALRKAEVAELEAKSERFLKMEPMPSNYYLQVMRDFIEELREPDVMKQLSNALNRKKPMRNFTQVVSSDEILGQHWFNFKSEEYQRYVSNFIIDAYNY